MTRQQFLEKWEVVMAGLALRGYYAENHLGPLERLQYTLRAPAKVRSLLEEMYADAQTVPQQPTQRKP